jgi:hypothetical protein
VPREGHVFSSRLQGADRGNCLFRSFLLNTGGFGGQKIRIQDSAAFIREIAWLAKFKDLDPVIAGAVKLPDTRVLSAIAPRRAPHARNGLE